jgi:hypothetical protein
VTAVEEALRDARHCAPVLERVIDILTADNNLTFGAALDRAQRELGILVPKHIEGPLLSIALKIIMNRKIPGAPEA